MLEEDIDHSLPDSVEVEGSIETSVDSASDEVLVTSCLERDDQAWTELVRRYRPTVMGAIRKKLAAYCDHYTMREAEDICQEVFHLLLKNDMRALRGLRNRRHLKSWLGVIAANKAIDLARRQHVMMRHDTAAVTEERAGYGDNPSPDPEFEERKRGVESALRELSEEDEQILRMYFLERLKYREIAELKEMPVSTVSSRIYRCKKKVAKALKDRGFL